MRFVLAIIPAFLVLSAFGSPIELDARQKLPDCNYKKCLAAVAPQFTRIHACAVALKNFDDIRIAQSMGKPPKKEDQVGLAANGGECLVKALTLNLNPPPVCRTLFTTPALCIPA
ncbi:hypothetical protein AGABI2DRAFT_196201 [Agaricus bisporus var. bisporus H97]|uniref:hypothetical protein n=1 Tax=Agaricus bisporus var. bisporus (strain H97 / ATCC MYA-4626 / FGSC 10389) TaxID=936046 RepID=UPI00029F6165|nr:hypothetical protein AGABI2DRAFT_196201 [Agaricus bisporus var. bisporus H97]EKV41701.1 hypothetical protein AGABI2DRAFT_196201 [Agaricus bisporus var. bisporus H97]